MEEISSGQCRLSATASWLHTHWPCATPFPALYTTILLLIFAWPDGTPVFWIWICLPVYFAHQCEEYLWPGGFMTNLTRRFVARTGTDPDTPLLSAREAYWINVGIIRVLFPATAVAAMLIHPAWGLRAPCFTVLNGLSHVVSGIQDRHYNPGLAASHILNIPVETAAILILADAGVAGTAAWAAPLLIPIGMVAFIAGYGVYRSRITTRK